MIDLHTHVLPGFDDGVRSIEEARELARAAAAEGVATIAATPHVRDDYPTAVERMERGVRLLNADFAEQGIGVEVITGGELDLRRLWELDPDDVARFTLGGAGRWLLLETPYRGWPELLPRTVEALRRQGIETLLAHPERNDEVQRDPSRLAPLVGEGMRVQVTAGSVDGRIGDAARRCSFALIELGLVHVLASDAHGPDVRGVGFASAIEALGDDALAARLTEEAPLGMIVRDGHDA
ncbi:MAG TPA: CpsB/CapC family capsule biosynthesis tyrosine phosphatase [Gaiellaceae bacterium]|nr:CpsB/CapC family capsule biosynthesis tyrosine phosphatase [Gaiellaceae bacterium]